MLKNTKKDGKDIMEGGRKRKKEAKSEEEIMEKEGIGRKGGGNEGARREWGMEGKREKKFKMDFGGDRQNEVWMNDCLRTREGQAAKKSS